MNNKIKYVGLLAFTCSVFNYSCTSNFNESDSASSTSPNPVESSADKDSSSSHVVTTFHYPDAFPDGDKEAIEKVFREAGCNYETSARVGERITTFNLDIKFTQEEEELIKFTTGCVEESFFEPTLGGSDIECLISLKKLNEGDKTDNLELIKEQTIKNLLENNH